MSKEPLRVTVIIPAYNASGFLEKAVRSVLEQTERNLELIIIDDCSPDDTWKLAESLAAEDMRIRAIQLPQNRGKSYAVNYATTQAKGKWIAILDADDWYAPTRLEKLLNAAEAANVDMVADNLIEFDSKANAYAGNTFARQDANSILTLDMFLAVSDPTTPCDYGLLKPIFKSSFVREHAITYYEPARLSEDFYILLCYFAAGGKALLYPEALYFYTQPYGTISHQWAQAGRKRYNYEAMETTHHYFVTLFQDRLTADQLQKLNERGEGIKALIYFYQIREAVASGDIKGVFIRVKKAPKRFWLLLGQRIYAKLFRR